MANKYEIKQLIKNESGQDELKIIHPKTDADIVTYDDTTTQLGVDNVQAAIEDLAGKVGSVSGDVSTELGNLGERIATLEGEMDAQQEVVQIGTHNDITLGVSSKPLTLAGFGSSPSYYSNDNKTYTLATTEKVNSIIDEKLAANDAMLFKGTIGSTTDGGTIQNLPTSKFDAGWTYKVVTKGTYSGFSVEVGDMFIAIKDYSGSGDIDPDDYWTVLQTNIDGAVISVATEAVGKIPVFNNATGTVLTKSNYAPTDFQLKVTALGSTTKPVYVSAAGTFAEVSTYAGGTKVTLNGTDKGASTATIYAPTAVGTDGQILKSNGSGAPTWVAQSDLSVSYASSAGSATTATTAKYATNDQLGNNIKDTYATKAELAKLPKTDTWRPISVDGVTIFRSANNTAELSLTSGSNITIDATPGSPNVTIAVKDTVALKTDLANYLPLSGGQMTGSIQVPKTGGGIMDTYGETLVADTGSDITLGNHRNNISIVNLKKLLAPTTSDIKKYGVGTNGQVLKTNGSNVYWGFVNKVDTCTNDTGSYYLPLVSKASGDTPIYGATNIKVDIDDNYYPTITINKSTGTYEILDESHVTDGTIAYSMFEIGATANASPSSSLSYGGLFFVPIG